MRRRLLLALAPVLVLAFAAAVWAEAGDVSRMSSPPPPGVTAPQTPTTAPTPPPRYERIRWRRSRSVGLPYAGRLVRGVRLPREGRDFFTWDPVKKRWGNRAWRRWGHDRLIRTVLRVLRAHRRANPAAPRIGIGDISRPRGGDFGPRYGSVGHASHQNGLDVDLYYPRLDGTERRARRVKEIDLRLSQDLVRRFVRVGARYVFVGPHTPFTGPRRIVVALQRHDDHLHVRLRPRRGGR
jgi:Penicillin-insensitive murein endopeptidase